MFDEYSEVPRDESEKRFTKLESQVTKISCNMMILMVALESKFGPLWEFGSSNLEAGPHGKSGDIEDLKKEQGKEN
jgi:hypothetical protein